MSLDHAKTLLMRASLGALFGAIVAAASWFALPRRSLSLNMLLELPLWLLATAMTVLPVTVLSAACARMALFRLTWPPLITACVVGSALSVASIYAYGWYMTEVAPAVSWWKGWWMPAAASFSTALIEAVALRRSLRAVGA